MSSSLLLKALIDMALVLLIGSAAGSENPLGVELGFGRVLFGEPVPKVSHSSETLNALEYFLAASGLIPRDPFSWPA